MLFDLDRAVQRLTGELGGKDRSVIELTGVYHNLLRRWADA
jgi:PKHD-type hydroxylase